MFKELFQGYYSLALNTYHVDPLVFIIIYVLATPFYYYGAFKAGKETIIFLSFQRKSKRRFSLHDLLLRRDFLLGYFINRISWFVPYAYVMLWGQNLQKEFYIILLMWVSLSSYLFLHNLQHKGMLTNQKVS